MKIKFKTERNLGLLLFQSRLIESLVGVAMNSPITQFYSVFITYLIPLLHLSSKYLIPVSATPLFKAKESALYLREQHKMLTHKQVQS